jgi:hypothetical protein
LYRNLSNLANTSAISLAGMLFIIFSVIFRGPVIDISLKGTDSMWTFANDGFFEVGFLSTYTRPSVSLVSHSYAITTV